MIINAKTRSRPGVNWVRGSFWVRHLSKVSPNRVTRGRPRTLLRTWWVTSPDLQETLIISANQKKNIVSYGFSLEPKHKNTTELTTFVFNPHLFSSYWFAKGCQGVHHPRFNGIIMNRGAFFGATVIGGISDPEMRPKKIRDIAEPWMKCQITDDQGPFKALLLSSKCWKSPGESHFWQIYMTWSLPPKRFLSLFAPPAGWFSVATSNCTAKESPSFTLMGSNFTALPPGRRCNGIWGTNFVQQTHLISC